MLLLFILFGKRLSQPGRMLLRKTRFR